MFRKALTSTVFMLLAACATTAGYEEILDSWMGSSESSIVSSWGAPDNVYTAPDGTRIITYYSSRNIVLPGTAPTYTTTVYGNTAYTTSSGGSPATNIGMSCETSFTIKKGRIISWRYQGNDCKA